MYKKNFTFFFIPFVISFFAILAYIPISFDILQYLALFKRYENYINFDEALLNERFEPAFLMLTWYINKFLSPTNVIYLVASCSFYIKIYLFIKKYKYKQALVVSIFYFILFALTIDLNIFREAIATIFIIYILLFDVKKIKIIFFTLLSVLFHKSGLFCLLGLIKGSNNKNYSIITMLILISLLICAAIPSQNIASYFKLSPDSKIFLGGNYLIRLLLISTLIKNWSTFNSNEKFGVFLLTLGSLIFLFPLNNYDLKYRLYQLTFLGIIPTIASQIKKNTHYQIYLSILAIANIVDFINRFWICFHQICNIEV